MFINNIKIENNIDCHMSILIKSLRNLAIGVVLLPVAAVAAPVMIANVAA